MIPNTLEQATENWCRNSFKWSHISPRLLELDSSYRIFVILASSDVSGTTLDTLSLLLNFLLSCVMVETAFICDSHIFPYIRVSDSHGFVDVHVVFIPQSLACRDGNLARFLDADTTGLKVTSDSEAMRALIIPSFIREVHSLIQGYKGNAEVVESLKIIFEWAEGRKILSNGDCGYFTKPMLAYLFVATIERTGHALSPIDYLRRFFEGYSNWNFNECSVGSFCCGLGRSQGSMIDEQEGIDSDYDEESRAKRLVSSNVSETLLASTDENDEVQPHKRHRFDLGAIRDLRRFYDVDNTRVSQVSADGKKTKCCLDNPLDKLDVFRVMHPSEPGINLGLRMLESHRKIIHQEFLRAQMLLEDVHDIGSVLPDLLAPKREVLDTTISIVVQVASEDRNVSLSVSSVIENQAWYLVQELQAHYGLLVIAAPNPISHLPSLRPETKGLKSILSNVVGLSFPSDSPYSADSGVEIDLTGPLSRLLMRTRQVLRGRPDWDRLEKRFIISCLVVRDIQS